MTSAANDKGTRKIEPIIGMRGSYFLSKVNTPASAPDDLISSINGVRTTKDKFDLEDAYHAAQFSSAQQIIAKKTQAANYQYRWMVNQVLKDASLFYVIPTVAINSDRDMYEDTINLSKRAIKYINREIDKRDKIAILVYNNDCMLGFARIMFSDSSNDSEQEEDEQKIPQKLKEDSVQIYWINKNNKSKQSQKESVLLDYKKFFDDFDDGDKIEWSIGKKLCDSLLPDYHLNSLEATQKLKISNSRALNDYSHKNRDKRRVDASKRSPASRRFDYDVLLHGSYQDYVSYVTSMKASKIEGSNSLSINIPVACKIQPETMKLYIDDLCHRILNKR